MPASDMAPILLIEDDPDIRALVASMLEDGEARLIVTRSGKEGLAKLQATAEHMVVVSSGVLRDISASSMLEAVVRDGGLARRHAFVLVTPEPDHLALAEVWQTQVPLFTLLEPYSRNELHAAVARAAECVALSRTLYGARSEPAAGSLRSLRRARRGKRTFEQRRGERTANAGVMLVGGELGLGRLMALLLGREPYILTQANDEQAALAWLRACPEPMTVLLNTTPTEPRTTFMRAAVEEARLVLHTYLLMVPTGIWLSPPQRELLGMLNAPVVWKPFAPTALRKSIRELTGAAIAAPGR